VTASAVDRAAEHLRAQILSGKLAPGARLPPERELAADLSINRLTLRAALAQLASANLVSVRQGSGYLVRPWRRDGGPELLRSLIELKMPAGDLEVIARDLLLVRRQLAVAVLTRLADGVSLPARRRIESAVRDYEARAEAGLTPDEAAELDLGILETILEATDSPVFQLCLNPVASVLRDLPALRQAMYADPLGGARAYGLLLGWLEHPTKDALPLVTQALEARDAITLKALDGAGAPLHATKKTARRKS
jgi:GntR family transcriptional repressor for pyruvate dehydrogenase complex